MNCLWKSNNFCVCRNIYMADVVSYLLIQHFMLPSLKSCESTDWNGQHQDAIEIKMLLIK